MAPRFYEIHGKISGVEDLSAPGFEGAKFIRFVTPKGEHASIYINPAGGICKAMISTENIEIYDMEPEEEGPFIPECGADLCKCPLLAGEPGECRGLRECAHEWAKITDSKALDAERIKLIKEVYNNG